MKVIIVALALVALAAALPAKEVEKKVKAIAEVISYINEVHENGYNYRFESDDGTVREEEGIKKEVLDEEKKPHQVYAVRGSYSYVNSEGQKETINYEADEDGFRAFGDSIPKPVSRR